MSSAWTGCKRKNGWQHVPQATSDPAVVLGRVEAGRRRKKQRADADAADAMIKRGGKHYLVNTTAPMPANPKHSGHRHHHRHCNILQPTCIFFLRTPPNITIGNIGAKQLQVMTSARAKDPQRRVPPQRSNSFKRHRRQKSPRWLHAHRSIDARINVRNDGRILPSRFMHQSTDWFRKQTTAGTGAAYSSKQLMQGAELPSFNSFHGVCPQRKHSPRLSTESLHPHPGCRRL